MSGPRRGMNYYDDEVVALVCHQATIGMQMAHEQMRRQRDGYVITGPFAGLHPDLYEAALAGVRWVRQLGASLEARDHHNDWVTFLESRGWRYGPEKDPDAKIHPNLVPWEVLDPDQQDKDRVFISIVISLSLGVAAS